MNVRQSETPTRILIIDDVQENIALFNTLLHPDYVLDIAHTGAQALTLASAELPPDMILLDLQLSDPNGFEVCRQLKDNPATRDIPVILITARASEEDEVRGLEMGAVDFFSKPLRPSILKARIKNHLTLLQQRRALLNMHHELLALSHTDALTGISNRRRMDEFLLQEWTRALRSKAHLGVLMIDIDFFKPYNDHYGHTAGDNCLKAVAAAMETQIRRPPDLIARYGGEEFVCILPDTNLNGVNKVGQAVRSAVAALQIPHQHSTAANIVTISLGGTACIPSRICTPHQLLDAADHWLYAAKADGRNRVVAQVTAD